MLYFWWGCRRNLKLITLGSERGNQESIQNIRPKWLKTKHSQGASDRQSAVFYCNAVRTTKAYSATARSGFVDASCGFQALSSWEPGPGGESIWSEVDEGCLISMSTYGVQPMRRIFSRRTVCRTWWCGWSAATNAWRTTAFLPTTCCSPRRQRRPACSAARPSSWCWRYATLPPPPPPPPPLLPLTHNHHYECLSPHWPTVLVNTRSDRSCFMDLQTKNEYVWVSAWPCD